MPSIKKSAMDIIKGQGSGIPWVPRWDLMYNSMKKNDGLPINYRNYSYYDITRLLGIGIASTRNKAYEEKLHNVDISIINRGYESDTFLETPYGELKTVYRTTPELEQHGVRGIITEYPVKSIEDIDIACFIIENTEILPVHEKLEEELEIVGEDGIVLAQAGYLPFHDIMRNWVGYEKFYLLYYDYPNEIKKILQTLENKFKKIEKVLLECPVEIITIDGHFNTALIPPYFYSEYFQKSLQNFSVKLHQVQKFMCSHTDGDMKGMLKLYNDSGFDLSEAFTPPPMTTVSVSEAAKEWKDKVTIWGGVASVMFSSEISEEDFEDHVFQLKHQTKDTRFIAGIGDNAPTDGVFERLIKVRDIFGGN